MNLELTDEQTRVLFAAARDYAEGCARILQADGQPGRPQYTHNTRDRARYELGVMSGLLRTLNAALPADDEPEQPVVLLGELIDVLLPDEPELAWDRDEDDEPALVDGPLPAGTYALVIYHDGTYEEITGEMIDPAEATAGWGAVTARAVVGPFDLFTLPDREHVGAVYEDSVATLAGQRNDLAWLCYGGSELFGTVVIWHDTIDNQPVPIDPDLITVVRMAAQWLQTGVPRANAWGNPGGMTPRGTSEEGNHAVKNDQVTRAMIRGVINPAVILVDDDVKVVPSMLVLDDDTLVISHDEFAQVMDTYRHPMAELNKRIADFLRGARK